MPDRDKELTIADTTAVAGIATSVLAIVDALNDSFELEVAEASANAIRADIGRLEALPFPSSLNKAETQLREVETFEALIKLFRARRVQKAHAVEKRFLDDEVLKNLGII